LGKIGKHRDFLVQATDEGSEDTKGSLHLTCYRPKESFGVGRYVKRDLISVGILIPLKTFRNQRPLPLGTKQPAKVERDPDCVSLRAAEQLIAATRADQGILSGPSLHPNESLSDLG
jgi:hypothetical protein